MAQIYQENITVGGTYTGTIKTDYLVKVFPTGITNTTKFQVITTNWDRNINLQFQGTSTAVKVRSDNGDGTYSDHATGIPIWVGDYLYETTGQTDISSAGNGYIGKVASITTGTEGVSVKAFALDATTYLDNISGSTKVDSVVKGNPKGRNKARTGNSKGGMIDYRKTGMFYGGMTKRGKK